MPFGVHFSVIKILVFYFLWESSSISIFVQLCLCVYVCACMLEEEIYLDLLFLYSLDHCSFESSHPSLFALPPDKAVFAESWIQQQSP